jgi:hypothetical protein
MQPSWSLSYRFMIATDRYVTTRRFLFLIIDFIIRRLLLLPFLLRLISISPQDSLSSWWSLVYLNHLVGGVLPYKSSWLGIENIVFVQNCVREFILSLLFIKEALNSIPDDWHLQNLVYIWTHARIHMQKFT